MRRLFASLAAVLSVSVAVGIPQVGATDLTGIGYVDQAQINATPEFRDVQNQLAAYKQQLDADFENQVRSTKGDDAQHALADQFSQRYAAKQHELVDPLVSRAQAAVAAIAQNLNLSVVVDRRIIIVGGLDITSDVVAQFHAQTASKTPNASSPPSAIGYVDQQTIDALPKVKAANTSYVTFQQKQHNDVQKALAAAKTDAARNAIVAQAQDQDAQQQEHLIDPIVDKTRSVMASIAKARHLALVVDKAAIIYGGTDVTSDVQSSLQ